MCIINRKASTIDTQRKPSPSASGQTKNLRNVSGMPIRDLVVPNLGDDPNSSPKCLGWAPQGLGKAISINMEMMQDVLEYSIHRC